MRENTRVASKRKLETLVVEKRSVLRVVRGVGMGQVYLLSDQPVVAGRSEDADMILDDPAISSRHFEVAPWQGGYVIRDLQSTNGTQVNHVRVAECRLADGDIISVGDTDVVFIEQTEVTLPSTGSP